MIYIATAVIVRFIQGSALFGMENGKSGMSNFSTIARGLNEFANVAIIVIKPALPKTIMTEAIRRLRGLFVISSASFVVNPVPVKHERAWNLAKDHSRPVN